MSTLTTWLIAILIAFILAASHLLDTTSLWSIAAMVIMMLFGIFVLLLVVHVLIAMTEEEQSK